jgi:Arc/MetJ-type ribon-helix-helix transcriptional regulator
MNLALPPEIDRLIDARVKSGRYKTPEDVVAAAVAFLDQQEHLDDLPPADMELLYPGIKAKLAEGLADARAGKLSDGDSFFEELDREQKTKSRPNRKTI